MDKVKLDTVLDAMKRGGNLEGVLAEAETYHAMTDEERRRTVQLYVNWRYGQETPLPPG